MRKGVSVLRYGLNYLIDNEHAVIVDVEATPARTYDEVASTRVMIWRTAERVGLNPIKSRPSTNASINIAE